MQGNEYYEVVNSSGRISRVVFASGSTEEGFDTGAVPVQWQGACVTSHQITSHPITLTTYTSTAWLRRSRAAPPTDAELTAAAKASALIQERVARLNETKVTPMTSSDPFLMPYTG